MSVCVFESVFLSYRECVRQKTEVCLTETHSWPWLQKENKNKKMQPFLKPG